MLKVMRCYYLDVRERRRMWVQEVKEASDEMLPEQAWKTSLVLGARASVSCLGGIVVLKYTHNFFDVTLQELEFHFPFNMSRTGDSFGTNRIWQKDKEDTAASFFFNSSWGSRQPCCCSHTQVALWKDSHGNEWKPPGN